MGQAEDLASLMQGTTRVISSVSIIVNKTQELAMNVQVSFDTPVKQGQRVEGKVSACEDQGMEMTRRTGSHSKELQSLRDKVLGLDSRSRRYNICIVEVPKACVGKMQPMGQIQATNRLDLAHR